MPFYFLDKVYTILLLIFFEEFLSFSLLDYQLIFLLLPSIYLELYSTLFEFLIVMFVFVFHHYFSLLPKSSFISF